MIFLQENRIFSLLPVSNSGLCLFFFFNTDTDKTPRKPQHLSQVFTATPLRAVGKFFIIGYNHGYHLKHVTYKVHWPSKKVRGDEM
jgi:hypothetical protein